MALCDPANNIVSNETKTQLAALLWPTAAPDTVQASTSWTAYFRYYTTECKSMIEYEDGVYASVRHHEDIVFIAEQLRDGLSKDAIREGLRARLRQKKASVEGEQMIEGSIILAARLIAMVDIGPVPYGVQVRQELPWKKSSCNLKTFLAEHFQECLELSSHRGIKFRADFTAFNIRRFTGIEVEWTDNIADHLRLMEDDTKLCVFHHVTFLRAQNDALYSSDFIDETLRTLGMLFPRRDRSTKKWLRSISKDHDYIDAQLMSCDRVRSDGRRADKFKFWSDRLIALKEEFDEPRVTSIFQFWHDRRNKVQWYTFWIALLVFCLTIFFGMIQSVEGAMQVYKAYRPTKP